MFEAIDSSLLGIEISHMHTNLSEGFEQKPLYKNLTPKMRIQKGF